jgi:hypothetical protein
MTDRYEMRLEYNAEVACLSHRDGRAREQHVERAGEQVSHRI